MKRFCILVVAISIMATACGPRQLLSPDATVTPTATEVSPMPTITETPSPTEVPMLNELRNLPEGLIAVHNEDGSWGIGVDEGENTIAISDVSVDSTGLHIAGKVDIKPEDIAKRVKVGLYSPFQVYNEAGTAIDYAYDAENKVLIKASDVLQPDNSNVEKYIKYDTIDDWLKANRLEKMVVTPFDPDTTYFPELDKIYRTDWNALDPTLKNTDVEFSTFYPFGKLPESMESPFRFVNFVDIKNGELYGYTEQIYNPADGSFTLIHEVFDNTNLVKWSALLRTTNTAEKRYSLPCYYMGIISTDPRYQSTYAWLKANGYMDASGNMPKVKTWVDGWLTTGYLSPETETILTYTCKRAFPQN